MVAYCGLYCGQCKKYLKGACPGCQKNEKASWCEVRKCCMENSFNSCAECKTYKGNLADCRKLNNFFSKFFKLVFSSDRIACLERIKEIGIEKFAKEMEEKKQMTIKTGGKK